MNTNSNMAIEVQRRPEPINTLVTQIAACNRPKVLFWYIGEMGLPQAGATFYRDQLVRPLRKLNSEATFYPVSLAAWQCLRNRSATSKVRSKLSRVINTANIGTVTCFASADYFAYCTKIAKPAVVKAIEAIWARPFIWKASESFSPKGIRIGDVFGREVAIFRTINGRDTAQTYSALQYLEAYFYIREIVHKSLEEKRIDIIFALPNDEWKYYWDEKGTFAQDVEKLLSLEFGNRLRKCDVNISIRCFEYGARVGDRPYRKVRGERSVKPGALMKYLN